MDDKINYAFSSAFTMSPDGVPQPHGIPNDDDDEIDEVQWYLLIAPELLTVPSKRICPESCFFIFASIRVPMYPMYAICTRERRNILLIEDQLR
jgi:hypothetical protein